MFEGVKRNTKDVTSTSKPESSKDTSQYEIWGFENIKKLIDESTEEDNIDDILESIHGRVVSDMTGEQWAQLSLQLSRKFKAEVKTVKEKIGIDPLTGLFNRRVFDERLPAFIESLGYDKGAPDSVMVILADIDYFKQFNDTYGHLSGDKVLVTVADRLRNSIREWGGDVICRWAGDEIGIIMVFAVTYDKEGKKIEPNYEDIFKRIKEEVNGDFFVPIDGVDRKVNLSFGHAVIHSSEYTNAKKKNKDLETKAVAGELFKKADEALYAAKAVKPLYKP